MKAMLAAEDSHPGSVLDRGFIGALTDGFGALVSDLEATTWADVVEKSGVARAEIERAAAIASASNATIVCWAMGITQHKHGVANVQTLVNFLLMQGNHGKPGAGACPVGGHSNVRGDRSDLLPRG